MAKPSYYIFGGRFQPFHTGHLAFLEHIAKSTGGLIVIGIVNPDPKNTWPGDGPDWIRFAPKDNPLNFWERLTCIRLSIEKSPIAKQVEAIVPLPRPSVNLERANQFLPPKPRHFALCERWGDEIEKWKAESYKRNGESVYFVTSNALPPQAQIAEGNVIRGLMTLGNPAWELLVPAPTIKYLKQLGLQSRLTNDVEKAEARRVIEQFYSNHPLGEFANEIFGELDDKEELQSDQANLIHRKLIRRKICQRLQTPLKEHEGETTVLLESTEHAEIDITIADLVRSGKIQTIPQFFPMSGGLCQAVMTSNTRDTLLSVLTKEM